MILLASSTMIETMSEPVRDTSDREQLKIATQKLMTQIVLEPGNPPDWGKDITVTGDNIRAFGLAKYSETTRDAYVLDVDKVLRLDNNLLALNNSLFLSPSSVISLLNLGNDYGLRLDFCPALNVSITRTSNSNRYEIMVNSEYGLLPIANAEVAAKIYYQNSSQKTINSTLLISNSTGVDGKCIINFDAAHPGLTQIETKILILAVDYYGIRVVKTFYSESNVTRGYLIGNHLLLNQTYDISRNETHQIIVAKRNGEYMIENVASSIDKVDSVRFDLLNDVEPSITALLALSEDATTLIFASREVVPEEDSLEYTSIQGNASFPFAYSIERSVMIGNSAYIVRLYLWRMSW